MKKKAMLFLACILAFSGMECFAQTLAGDANGDGNVTIVDALVVAQAYVGLNPSPYIAANADANCSGSVDIVDALLIAQYYVGLIGPFQSCTQATATPTAVPTATPTVAPTSVPQSTPTTVPSSAIYVSPSGNDSNDGSSGRPLKSLSVAVGKASAGTTIYMAAGTYSCPDTITLSKAGTSSQLIRIEPASGSTQRVVLDFGFAPNTWEQDSYGLFVTGSYWYIKGVDVTRAGYQGAYVTGSHNTFEFCRFFDNRNTGIEINEGGSYTTLINCDAYKNYDPKKFGSMADGIAPKQTMGAGNKLIGCRAWNNSDDGFDCFDSPEVVTFENCWAFYNGIDIWNYGGFTSNQNGFKIGGNSKQANHVLRNCVVFGQPKKGFDQNNNTGGLTLYNCLAYGNGTNYALGGTLNSGQKHVLKNCVSLDGPNTIANSTESNNTWNSGFSVSTGDFQSLDESLATMDRNADGSIPETALFRLKQTSALVNKGVNVGLPYNGSAPDIGAFESAY